MEKCKPVIILAGTAIGSVLSLCKNGTLSGHKMFVVCTDRKSCACYQTSRTEGFLQISDMAGISCADASFQWYTYRNDAYKHRSQKQEVRYVTLMGFLLNIIRTQSFQSLFHYVGNLLFDKQTYIAEFYTERRPYKASVK